MDKLKHKEEIDDTEILLKTEKLNHEMQMKEQELQIEEESIKSKNH